MSDSILEMGALGPERPFDRPGPARCPSRQAFSHHRQELPMILILACFALIELPVMHLLLSLWNVQAAWAVSALTLLCIGHMLVLACSIVRRPTLVEAGAVRVRYGCAGEIVVPIDHIFHIQDTSLAPEPAGRGVFRATVLAHPNLTLHLRPPIHRKRGDRVTERIALRMDDPAAFCEAVAQCRPEASAADRSLREQDGR